MNGMEDNLPYQFRTKFRAWYLQKNLYECQKLINNILTEVFNIYFMRILFFDKSRYFGCVYCTNNKYCILVSTLHFPALIP